jgi:hypothetical protein
VRPRRIVSLFVLTSLLSLGVVPVAFAAEVAAPALVDAELALDAPAGTNRTAVHEAPIAFSSLWAELPGDLDAVRVRTSADGSGWGDWVELPAADPLEAPDAGTAEADAAAAAPRVTELLEVGDARYVQVDAAGEAVGDVVLRLADTAGLNESLLARVGRHLSARPVPAAEAATVPTWVKPRSSWGAAPYKGTPSVARGGAQQIVLHHSASRNDLRRADGTCNEAGITARIRSYQHYHQNAQGWSDIGYNVVIDPCGGVWEGRAGGLDRAVVGAHAANYNTGSTGISVIGNYEALDPNPQILAALDRVVGWKAGIHGIDTTGTVTRTVNGVTRTFPTVIGHTDVGNTACPGRIMQALPRIRTNARSLAGGWDRVPDDGGTTSTAPRFRDTAGSPHEAAIEQLVRRGITDGYADRTFRPQQEISRAQVAAFLAKALALPPVTGDRFRDVDAGYVHAGAINALVETGIISGYANGTFRPNDPLRREHMAAVISRALALAPDPQAAAVFRDVTGYAGEIGAIAQAGITTGRGNGTFQPQASVTRGQMATFLVNAIRILETRAASTRGA